MNSICEEMFNMLQNDIENKEFCCEILTETESCDALLCKYKNNIICKLKDR